MALFLYFCPLTFYGDLNTSVNRSFYTDMPKSIVPAPEYTATWWSCLPIRTVPH
jgi:hypothetical protein